MKKNLRLNSKLKNKQKNNVSSASVKQVQILTLSTKKFVCIVWQNSCIILGMVTASLKLVYAFKNEKVGAFLFYDNNRTTEHISNTKLKNYFRVN